MPYSKGKFKSPGAHSTGEKSPEKSEGNPPPVEKGAAPHEDVGEKHVTETHPGQTQPHSTTGVHAFHAHHTGGGKYTSHTHHDGGDVETRQHPSSMDMHQAMKESLPDDGQNQQQPPKGGGMDMMNELSGIGGAGSM